MRRIAKRQRSKRALWCTAAALFGLSTGPSRAVRVHAAPGGSQDAGTTSAGVYSEAQSARGETVSTKSCAVCHGDQLKGGDLAPALQGSEFLKNWAGKTAGELSDRIETTMPANEPGTLSPQQLTDVVAYIFKVNGFPAGASELPKEKSGLNAIKIVPAK
jgi:mono/diheme cytochrome c family protein